MRRPDLTLERIRPLAGPVLLGVFLFAAQCSPLAHLATHRSDHTHGPETAPDHDDDSHDDDHDRDGSRDHEAPVAVALAPHEDHDHDRGEPADPPASNDHGRASSAHFGLALLEGPTPPFLPPPALTLAPPPDVALRWHHAPSQPLPPARGPPRLSLSPRNRTFVGNSGGAPVYARHISRGVS